jgi:hypothetical protein
VALRGPDLLTAADARLRGQWTPVPSGLFRDRRFRGLSKDARLLHLAAHLYANQAETDGELSATDLPLVVAEADADPGAVRELVAAGFWEDRGAVHVLLDFMGLPREVRDRRRDAARARQHRHRHPGAVQDVEAVTRDVTRDSGRDTAPLSPRTPLSPPRGAEGREVSKLKPLVSMPARGDGLAADADPRNALGDRLVAALGGLVAGGALSPPDQSRVRRWPYAFQHLQQRGEGAFLEPCRRLAEEAAERGAPPRTVKYFEPRLGELDAEMVDAGAARPARGHVDGMQRLGQVLGGPA